MSRIRSDLWRPAGIQDLEPAALEAIRDTGHTCVVAGPGSGKSELLAQKAAFLFETVQCPAPYRILAISFKKDAAKNLADRVAQRCHQEDANRFDSVTFDSFTKNLIDRFRTALPAYWQPSSSYRILSNEKRYFKNFVGWLAKHRAEWRSQLEQIDHGYFNQQLLGSLRIPSEPPGRTDDPAIGIPLNWLAKTIRLEQPSLLSFMVLNRLTSLLLETSPAVRRGLVATYPFVFVDEFQDTTHAQYDLLTQLFEQSRSAITTVGDNKQRVMVWAGARTDALDDFCARFGAHQRKLTWNHRSTSSLVRFQRPLALQLEQGTADVTSKSSSFDAADPVRLWRFKRMASECEQTASWIGSEITAGAHSADDFAILVRQNADLFEAELITAFRASGVKLTNYARQYGRLALQDLLKDQYCQFGISMMRLAVQAPTPQNWQTARDTLVQIAGINADVDHAEYMRIDHDLREKVETLRNVLVENSVSADSCKTVAAHISTLATPQQWKRTYVQYSESSDLELAQESWLERLESVSSDCASWNLAATDFTGDGAVKLMSLHKSKGLEFPTVVLFALDDETWWSYKKNRTEALSTLFVGVSRAESRVIMTHCTQRGGSQMLRDLLGFLPPTDIAETSFD